jgi:hypothetical protein
LQASFAESTGGNDREADIARSFWLKRFDYFAPYDVVMRGGRLSCSSVIRLRQHGADGRKCGHSSLEQLPVYPCPAYDRPYLSDHVSDEKSPLGNLNAPLCRFATACVPI